MLKTGRRAPGDVPNAAEGSAVSASQARRCGSGRPHAKGTVHQRSGSCRRRVRQVEQEPPDRHGRDRALTGLNLVALVPGHERTAVETQFRHRLVHGGRFAFPRQRIGQRFTTLDQCPGAAARRHHEIDLLAGPRPVVEDLRVHAPERDEDEVLEQVSGVDEEAG